MPLSNQATNKIDQNEVKTETKKVIIYVIDHDSCLTRSANKGDFPHTLIGDQHKRVIESNDECINFMIEEIHQKELLLAKGKDKDNEAITVYVMNGSNRNSFPIDMNNLSSSASGSCFPAIQGVYNAIVAKYKKSYPESNVEFKLDSYLLADTCGEKEDGNNFQNALDVIAVYDPIVRVYICYDDHSNSIAFGCNQDNTSLLKLKEELERLKTVHVQFLEHQTETSLLENAVNALLTKLETSKSVEEVIASDQYIAMKKAFYSLICSSIEIAKSIITGSIILKESGKNTILESLSKLLAFFSQPLNAEKNYDPSMTENEANLSTIEQEAKEGISNLIKLLQIIREHSHEENNYFEPMDNCLLDKSKFILVWMQLQRAALRRPDTHIEYTLIDDDASILGSLLDFLEEHSELIPKNIRFSTIQYEQKNKLINKDKFKAIKGTGELYPDPRSVLTFFQNKCQNFHGFLKINTIELLKSENKEKYWKIFRRQAISLAKDTHNDPSTINQSSSNTLHKNTIFSVASVAPKQPEEENKPTTSLHV